jgi:DNA-binding MarR family transcriptional regulator
MSDSISRGLSQDLFQIIKQLPRVRVEQTRHLGLTASELELLGILAINLDEQGKPPSVTEMSQFMKITPAGVTHLINPLEKSGCIERLRASNDRRVVLIGLTDKGKEIAQRIISEAQELMIGLVQYLGEDDSQTLIQLMKKMIEFFAQQPARDNSEK